MLKNRLTKARNIYSNESHQWPRISNDTRNYVRYYITIIMILLVLKTILNTRKIGKMVNLIQIKDDSIKISWKVLD